MILFAASIFYFPMLSFLHYRFLHFALFPCLTVCLINVASLIPINFSHIINLSLSVSGSRVWLQLKGFQEYFIPNTLTSITPFITSYSGVARVVILFHYNCFAFQFHFFKLVSFALKVSNNVSFSTLHLIIPFLSLDCEVA